MASSALQPNEQFEHGVVVLSLVGPDDVTPRYVAWLQDPEVNRYLETRFEPQTLDTVRAFVDRMIADPVSFLFKICDRRDGTHVGNIRVGPVNRHHLHADVSYFIGDRSRWGRGLATDAIFAATDIGLGRLGLHRLQAGVYERNVGSIRALEKVGYKLEARFRAQLRGPDGWEDHIYLGILASEWKP